MTNAFTIPKESFLVKTEKRMFRKTPRTAKASNMHPIVLPGSTKNPPPTFIKENK